METPDPRNQPFTQKFAGDKANLAKAMKDHEAFISGLEQKATLDNYWETVASPTPSLTIKQEENTEVIPLRISSPSGAPLLTIKSNGEVVAPSVESATEAGRAFVEAIRDSVLKHITPSLAAAPDLDLEARRDYQRGYIQGRWDATQSLVKQAEALWNSPPILIDAPNIDSKFLASLVPPSPAAPSEGKKEEGGPVATLPEASPRGTAPEGFYVLSLKHSKKQNGVLTWWAPDNKGYQLVLERAGVYSKADIDALPDYYNNGTDNVAIPCAVALKFKLFNATYVGDCVPFSRKDDLLATIVRSVSQDGDGLRPQRRVG